ncbi:MAG: hypothetical protein GX674_10310 [Clostridiales bacterium]|nr:hypothetical protein [Clostridiales bacterium]
MMKIGKLKIIASILLSFYAANALVISSIATSNTIYSLHKVWANENIKITFDGTVNSIAVGDAIAYEVEFNIPIFDTVKSIGFADSFSANSMGQTPNEHITEATSESGETLSFSYGDVEYASSRFAETYAPLFSMAVDRSDLGCSIPNLDGFTFSSAYQEFIDVSKAIGISYMSPTLVCWLTQNDLQGIDYDLHPSSSASQAQPFYGIFAPVAFMNIPVIHTSYTTINNTIIIGTQGQAIISSDGIEFFYSGRGMAAAMKPINEQDSCMSFDRSMQFLISSFDDLLLSEPIELFFDNAQVYYVPIPLDTVKKRFTYIPYWFFHHESGVFAFNAITGERLI